MKRTLLPLTLFLPRRRGTTPAIPAGVDKPELQRVATEVHRQLTAT